MQIQIIQENETEVIFSAIVSKDMYAKISEMILENSENAKSVRVSSKNHSLRNIRIENVRLVLNILETDSIIGKSESLLTMAIALVDKHSEQYKRYSTITTTNKTAKELERVGFVLNYH